MDEITRVEVDLAKRVIQVHAVNAAGRVVAAKALAREHFVPWCARLPPGVRHPYLYPTMPELQPQFLRSAQPKGRRVGAPILQMGR